MKPVNKLLKYYITLLAIVAASVAMAQPKDTRAALDIQGRINEISVSPTGQIWLVTAMGKTYYTNSIDSNWHYCKPLPGRGEEYDIIKTAMLDRASFFNKDTAIITGYIAASKDDIKTNGYYRTTDGGKTWKLQDYGGNSWIYTICTDKNGNAWMGGLSKEIYYSSDYGQKWKTIKLPFHNSNRVYAICMANIEKGITGSERNEILATTNNWQSVNYLPTPFHQKAYTNDEGDGYIDSRVSKIEYWGNYIVVKQDGHIFYTDAKNIHWKAFPLKVIAFEVDKETAGLYAVTNDLAVVLFSSPLDYKYLSDKHLSGNPVDVKVANHALYVVCRNDEVFIANEKGLIRNIPYTTDKPIDTPENISEGSRIKWGASDNQLYLATAGKNDWYREAALDFRITTITLQNDSTAILWDGEKNNYRYSLSTHKPEIYIPENPLGHFLASPVATFVIKSGSHGCFHNVKTEVVYKKNGAVTFLADTMLSTYMLYNEDQEKNYQCSKTKWVASLWPMCWQLSIQLPTGCHH